jgi:tetratricopeptide (TPR) repeat protein
MMKKAKLKQHRSSKAIALAMQSRWEEAVAVNKSIIELFPNDVDAYNRLGKALTELGRYAEAEEAYKRVLNIAPNNAIAKRNLDRLSHLREAKQGPKDRQGLDLSLFIEEMGKSAVVDLLYPAPEEVLTRMAAGERVCLKVEGQKLIVVDRDSEYLGEIEPKLGLRLIKLMEGGNRYQAVIASLGKDGGRVIIKETFQHPSQAGRPSFPSRASDGFRAYIKDSMLKYELDEEEAIEWDEEALEDASSFEDIAEPEE